MNKIVISIFTILALATCKNNDNNSDATGTFEAVETIISSEANGVIKDFKLEEGQELKVG